MSGTIYCTYTKDKCHLNVLQILLYQAHKNVYYFKDNDFKLLFLFETLNGISITGAETDSAAGDTGPLEVQHVLQWMTGQSHIPILPDEKRCFKITCNFNHECREQQGDHSVCYPTVSACTQTVTFPVQHLGTYDDFRRIMSEAVRYGGGFHRV